MVGRFKAMLLVIVGAGASYDSFHEHPPPPERGESAETTEARPPLANSLFDSRSLFTGLHETLPQIRAIVPELQASDNVEAKLAEINADEGDPGVASEILAVRFYLQHALFSVQNRWFGIHHGVTNHTTLARFLRAWSARTGEEVSFVSFNYDTLLEEGISAAYRGEFKDLPADMKWYLGKRVHIHKPHGSVNWLQATWADHENISGTNAQMLSLIDRAGTFGTVDNLFEVRNPGDYFHMFGSQQYWWVPAISIPLEETTTFMLSKDAEKAMLQDLGRADKVLIVGWRASENDFLSAWKGSRPDRVRALVVDPDPQVAINNLLGAGCIDDADEAGYGFTRLATNPKDLAGFLTPTT